MGAAVKLDPIRTIFFPYNRWSESGSTVTASDEVSAFPATNTKLQQRSKIWRSSTLTTPYLQADLGQARKVSGVCFVSHNLTRDATWRYRVSNNSDMSSPLVDVSGLDVWEAFLPADSEWSDANGKPTADMIALLEFCAENPRVVRWETFDEVNGRYVRLNFDDSGNSDGFVEVAWCYAGVNIELDIRHTYGWEMWVEDNVRRHISATGQHWTDIHNRKLQATAEFQAQKEDFAMSFWHFLTAKLGITGEMVVALLQNDLASKFWLSMYCRMQQVPQQQQQAVKNYRVPLRLEELAG